MMNEPTPAWDELPTETEIYILPNGEIIVADLPMELATTLGPTLPKDTPETAHADQGTATLKHAE